MPLPGAALLQLARACGGRSTTAMQQPNAAAMLQETADAERRLYIIAILSLQFPKDRSRRE
ncbi:MAG: hypothetical protein ACREUF_02825 [Solimonas sp.]